MVNNNKAPCTPAQLTLGAVRAELLEYGVHVQRTIPGESELRVYLFGAKRAEGYYTTDLADALATGKAMARECDARKARTLDTLGT